MFWLKKIFLAADIVSKHKYPFRNNYKLDSIRNHSEYIFVIPKLG